MDYIPRHPQPFTLAEATHLEVPVLTEGSVQSSRCLTRSSETVLTEIARLQNSLNHLERTQDELKENMTGSNEEDSVLEEAYMDNSKVIASQKERVTILKMALSNKGIPYSSHYDVPSNPQTQARSPSGGTSSDAATHSQADDGGIDL
ncbi:hypothetical protein OE88DRAFT_1722924 [Heliocybe sulcata]|uniref:Uncharacterized protein n=1 Tax=Heliocybe sulcata TaxID=5364 RepID=A0A5C3NE29_9AGAM|nr:hypothetical protein OE88DRAFT_1722924 [Heliocybe sulcata]